MYYVYLDGLTTKIWSENEFKKKLTDAKSSSNHPVFNNKVTKNRGNVIKKYSNGNIVIWTVVEGFNSIQEAKLFILTLKKVYLNKIKTPESKNAIEGEIKKINKIIEKYEENYPEYFI